MMQATRIECMKRLILTTVIGNFVAGKLAVGNLAERKFCRAEFSPPEFLLR